jgi:hypothetical protein
VKIVWNDPPTMFVGPRPIFVKIVWNNVCSLHVVLQMGAKEISPPGGGRVWHGAGEVVATDSSDTSYTPRASSVPSSL